MPRRATFPVENPADSMGSSKLRGTLFRKYVVLVISVLCVALLTNGLLEVWFLYQEHQAALIRIQREQAEAAAAKISQFVKEIESQIGWTTQLPWPATTMEQRRVDAFRLLRQVPAITEFSQLDHWATSNCTFRAAAPTSSAATSTILKTRISPGR